MKCFWSPLTNSLTKKQYCQFFCYELVQELVSQYGEAVQRCWGLSAHWIGLCTGQKYECRASMVTIHCKDASKAVTRDFNCLVYQTVALPDAQIKNLFGQVELVIPINTLSKYVIYLKHEHYMQISDEQHYISGDQEYVISPWLHTENSDLCTSTEKASYNKHMKIVRTSVEWIYGELKQHFTSPDLHVRFSLTNLQFLFSTFVVRSYESLNFFRLAFL